ncbi:glycosyltransferase family 39 protein [Kibdelosporangium philippinense]|uniref:Glycosyltransferase family 39 protein n=1 Tax=Kibdelosporangium philippinense TaxID=211113 RepID=A0ABS8ZUX0_9PSEU|nr:glycosyltransferase family 39 protein [Kibdelosporangium philippinense]MCE7009627.1 glycosyltransferase family 39 protein [Kibdelosporangium philippinense]
MTVAAVEHAEVMVASRRPAIWHRYALAAILVAGGVFYASVLWSGSWGNTYYTAAVKSMSLNFTNFVFGSFDPAGVVTVDKPPLALWPQVISVWIFGYHDWSVLLPQVIEGVAAIFLLHRTVRLWAGQNAALVAALIFALTPITVVTNRTNNTDTMLVLMLVAAAYAFTRAMKVVEPRTRTKWLWFAAFLIGCGFLAKMLAAWIVVPAFVAAYLAGSKANWRRKAFDVIGAAVVLLASSLWWVAVVDLWPGRKPYIGGSTDGSALDLVLGYNGLGRVFGGEGRSGGVVFGGGSGPGGGGAATGGLGGGGVSGGGGAGGIVGGGGPGGAGGGGANLAFGGEAGPGRMFGEAVGGQISWLLPLALIALVVASVLGFRRFRRFAPADTAQRAGWVLWGTWLIVNALVFSLQEGIFHPYYTTVMAPAIGALVGVGTVWAIKMYREPKGLSWLVLPASVAVAAAWAWVLISRDTAWNGWLRWAVLCVAVVAILVLVLRKAKRAAIVLGVVAVLLAPGVWSGAGAFASTGNPGIPMAGPAANSAGGFILRLPPGQTTPPPGMMPPQNAGPARANGTLTADQRKIVDYAKANAGGAEYLMAVEGGAQAASAYIMATDENIVSMGGFSGRDPAPTVEQLATWVKDGKLKFVLVGGRGGMRGGQASATSTWVQENCRSVLTAGTQQLYECTVE